VIEYEECYSFCGIRIGWHSFCSFGKIIYIHDNVMFPAVEVGFHVMKSIPHFVKGPMETIVWRGAGCVCIFFEKV
jgi:hypothetical protein